METVLITGANRGIGFAMAEKFLAEGFRVIATYRKNPGTLREQNNLILQPLEATDAASIQALTAVLSDQSIDILINNAGIIGPEDQSLEGIDPKAWLDTFAVNTVAPLMLSRALLENVKRSKRPRIIAISSQMGSLNRNSPGMYAYRSSKAALNKVMQVLVLELKADGVCVCPVDPGWVKTDMGGDGADITPAESAAGIFQLANVLTLEQSGTFFTWNAQVHDW